MLTDDLKEVFRDRAEDVDADAVSLIADLDSRLSRQRRRRPLRAAVVAAAVVAVVVASVALGVQLTSSGQTETSVAATSDVPCATPDVVPDGYVDWPCAEGPVDDYFRAQFDHPAQFDPGIASFDRDARVLAFGDMPASRPGGRFLVAETWNPRTLQTKLHAIFSTPAGVLPQSVQNRLAQHAIGPADPVPAGTSEGPAPAAGGGLILVAGDRPTDHYAADCTAQLSHIPGPRHGYFASCSDLVLARSDVTDIQLLHGGTPVGSRISVVNHTAGLPNPLWRRPGWTIEALNADGAVVGSIPWQTVL